MQLFDSLKLLMALLGSSCPLFGRSGPKMSPKNIPKIAQNRKPKYDMFFLFFFFWFWLEPKMTWAKAKNETQNGPGFLHKIQKRFTRETKMSPRGPSGALKSLFKNLKKPCVFTRFWAQRPPKKPSRNPRAEKMQKTLPKKQCKNLTKKIPKNAVVVKNALSRRSPF